MPVSGGIGLDSALTAAGGNGTVEIGDSRTYSAVSNPGSTASPIHSLLIQAGDLQRPVIRLAPPATAGAPPTAWTFTGGGGEALSQESLPSLTLDGLLFSGGDIVLTGAFASVRLTGFTADPGTAGSGPGGFATSVDGRALAPTTIWIQADPGAQADAPNAVAQLEIDNCILGPVRTRNGGAVESVSISDSIVQGLAQPAAAPDTLTTADVYDPALLATVLGSNWPPAHQLFDLLPAPAQAAITAYATTGMTATSLSTIVTGLNALISGTERLDLAAPALAGVPLDPDLRAALATAQPGDIAAINRRLLEAALPVALAPAALAFDAGSVALERVTVLGSAFMHDLTASDSILAGFTTVQDAQQGYVRHSAVASGTYTPRRFSCATITPEGALFTSSDFGQPGYAQLLETVDQAIASAPAGVTISAGAENSSEMGAYCSGLAPVKENGLLIKFDEYMPLGLTPVIVHVT
jgi:hypothetical protein